MLSIGRQGPDASPVMQAHQHSESIKAY